MIHPRVYGLVATFCLTLATAAHSGSAADTLFVLGGCLGVVGLFEALARHE